MSIWLLFFICLGFFKEDFDLFSLLVLVTWARGLLLSLMNSNLVLQILVKTMIRKRSFGNPFEGSKREERSLSAPGNLLP